MRMRDICIKHSPRFCFFFSSCLCWGVSQGICHFFQILNFRVASNPVYRLIEHVDLLKQGSFTRYFNISYLYVKGSHYDTHIYYQYALTSFKFHLWNKARLYTWRLLPSYSICIPVTIYQAHFSCNILTEIYVFDAFSVCCCRLCYTVQ